MTPKEKAEELINKYFKYLNYEFGDYVYSLRDKQPQQCALICVEEIINLQNMDEYLDYSYWEEVKEELEKL